MVVAHGVLVKFTHVSDDNVSSGRFTLLTVWANFNRAINVPFMTGLVGVFL
ncbi:hypothetical protein YPPY66_3289 [Yersinia pestis PY-66]|uniref:Uncharacterized protein n=4 Tax=Yersinia pestis TaxID=632 RepID=Q8CLJ5_YERPE|nr:hypothetical [Yersinia pestis KIM10+]ABG17434.1 conserved hypothetical protein [Yersinia pestis Nepal516]ABP41001.1 conserved hypothetical protein [Yersinia pestis Pestoides F]ABX86726.1 conserved hypothetical protein [Yersinia pestis Angola]ADV99749.1 hypothetical protein YPC_3256 [Yersinia pestis biovar Medievalis str. Harbin 35]EDR33007.1 conserved hypothetical protein [Yersinia pestis biovar Orientalis str. IP275]EDR40159.1 conserved hypothetical protein [Yersinia pestis biovar Orienta